MFDVGALSRESHAAFEVPVTVERCLEASRTERAVLYLDTEERSPSSVTPVLSSLDRISFAFDATLGATPDIKKDDVVVCADTRIVSEETEWVISDRAPLHDDKHVRTWWMVQTSPVPEPFYSHTITLKSDAGRDTNGDATLSDAVVVNCWVEDAASMLDRFGFDLAGTTVFSTLEREFLTTDRVWLPEDVVDTTPKLGRRFQRVWSAWKGGQRVYLATLEAEG